VWKLTFAKRLCKYFLADTAASMILAETTEFEFVNATTVDHQQPYLT
jgi:hypothetical protein